MVRLRTAWVIFGFCLGQGMWEAVKASDPSTEVAARWTTFDASPGEGFFALSLKSDLRSLASPAASTSLVLLVDTSASQTGRARIDSLAIARAIVESLPASAKVAIAACDVDTQDLSSGLQSPQSSEVRLALQRLESRLPLGTTDLEAALRYAVETLSAGERKGVVYLGDGISRSHVLDRQEFQGLIDRLVASRTSVTSLAIGPVLNVEGLATIANHTGGCVFVRDRISGTTQEIGRGLSQVVQEPVFWSQDGDFPQAMAQRFPQALPPLRSDRDSILIGNHDAGQVAEGEVASIAIRGSLDGQVRELRWQVKPELNHPDFAFLPNLVEKAKADKGLYLPTAGSEALRGLSDAFVDHANQLVESGRFALQSGDVAGAIRIAKEALSRDPNNAGARNLLEAAQQKADATSWFPVRRGKVRYVQVSATEDLFGNAQPEVTSLPNAAAPEAIPPAAEAVLAAPPVPVPPAPAPAAAPPAPALAPPAANPLPGYSLPTTDGFGELATAGDLLTREESLRRLRAEQFETSTRARIREAQQLLVRDPIAAELAMKQLLSDVRRATDLEPGVRAKLEATVRSDIETASRKATFFREQAARAEEVRANVSATERILTERERDDAAVKQLVERFNALMDQQLYEQANTEIAPIINDMLPNTVISNMVEVESGMLSNYRLIQDVIYAKRRGFVDVMYQVEKASVPFADDPPVVYPPADVWRALSARRLERYGSIDLSAGTSPNEKRIYDALKSNIKPEFSNTPLRQVMESIATEKQIPIILDTTAIEGGGTATPEDPITLTNVPEISMRSALRLILDPLELTYVIEDEVMKITTKDQGSARVLRIYPVGDLVIPVMSGGMGGGMMGGGMMGGGMGGGMGGMGGGMGGMGGGMGGMGGGMGGMGGGMGGMGGGGMFAVQDEPRKEIADSKPGKTTATAWDGSLHEQAEKLVDRILVVDEVKVKEELEQQLAKLIHDRLEYAKTLAAPEDKEQFVREFQAIIEMISMALRKGAPQPWMYEALSLSMQVCDYPAEDIRRVLLSAVDFSGDVEDAIKIGKYLAKQGYAQEALRVFRDAARVQPLRADIYEAALPLAMQSEDWESLQWTSLGVLSQAWPVEQAKLVETAELAAKSVLVRMNRDGRVVESKAFEQQLKLAQRRDVVVRVSWTGKADLDLSVEEPSGTICSVSNPRTLSGGVLLNDGNPHQTASVEGYSESYACPQGYSGEYRILIEKIWGEVAGGKVTVDILTDFGTPEQRYRREQIPLASKDALLKIGVKHGHRETPMVDISVAKSETEKLAAGRAVLAQQLAGSDYSANNGLAGLLGPGSGIPGGNNPFFNPFRGAVGYRPIITVLPQGTMMAAIAVVSGDRRYVRVTPFPNFTDIIQVDTFNFITGDSTTQGGGLSGGGGGGGFGGGGNF